MDEESKHAAKQLAENLNLKLRGVVQRALPEYYHLDRDAKTIFKGVTDTQRLNLALDFVFLDERDQWLRAEQIRLKAKYRELNQAIQAELAECAAEKERLLSGIRYSLIRESVESPEEETGSSAPTNLIPPSKELPQK